MPFQSSSLGERAFEIVLARRVAARRGRDAVVRAARLHADHRAPDALAGRVPARSSQRRIEVIERDRNIGLIERPECKRRWQSEPWEDKEQSRAARPGCSTGARTRSLWFGADGEPRADDREPAGRPAAHGRRRGVGGAPAAGPGRGPGATCWRRSSPTSTCRSSPSTATSRPAWTSARQWERTWDLQREEDATGKKPGHRGPAEVRGRRLPEAVVLAAPRQARRAQGAVHLLPRRQPRQRPELPADRLGRLGPPGAGGGADRR